MNRLINFLLYLYIFVSSWTMAYKIGGWFTIPNIIIMILVSLYCLNLLQKGKIKTAVYKIEDMFLILGIFFITLSCLVNSGNVNYIFAYFFVFCILYLIVKQMFYEFSDTEKLFKINTISIGLVVTFIILEFLCHYILDINIRERLKFGIINEATYLARFHRSYGFSTEPTNLGYYLNALGPIALWYLYETKKYSKIFKVSMTILYILGLATTFSAAAFVSFFVSLAMVIFIYCFKNKNINVSSNKILIMMLLLMVIVSALMINKFTFNKNLDIGYYIEPIIKKITLSGQSNIEDSRIDRWQRDLISFKESPLLGYGPGMTTIYHGGSSANWYLNVLIEDGMLALICIITFFFITFLRIYKSNIKNKYYFMVGYLSSVIHLSTLSTFYDPAIWLLLVIFHVYNERGKIGDIPQRI